MTFTQQVNALFEFTEINSMVIVGIYLFEDFAQFIEIVEKMNQFLEFAKFHETILIEQSNSTRLASKTSSLCSFLLHLSQRLCTLSWWLFCSFRNADRNVWSLDQFQPTTNDRCHCQIAWTTIDEKKVCSLRWGEEEEENRRVRTYLLQFLFAQFLWHVLLQRRFSRRWASFLLGFWRRLIRLFNVMIQTDVACERKENAFFFCLSSSIDRREEKGFLHGYRPCLLACK